MSEPAKETVESPDYFAVPVKGEGTKRINWKPKAIGVLFIALVVGGVVYTFYDRMQEFEYASQKEIKPVKVAVPPVKKPDGPDVFYPAPEMRNQGGSLVPVSYGPVDEAAKEGAAKKAAELDAAMKAPPDVEKFARRQRQAAGGPQGGRRGLMPPEDEREKTSQDAKRDFLKAKTDYSPYLAHTLEKPVSPYEIKAGTFIPGVMVVGINSELPGQMVGKVRENVYDTATGQYLLIPAGATLLGTYDSDVVSGQERVLTAWERIIYPDGSSIFLGSMPGADKSGIAGFHDQVNNHYVRTFGQAFLLSIFSAGMQLSQPRGAVGGTYNAQQIGAAALGQQMAQLGMQLARRNLNRQPTLEIGAGYAFNVMSTKDMVFQGPWRGHPLASNE
jgi:type IV secretion system protein TrbI